MTTSTILTIDLGKYNSVSCHYEPESKSTQFCTIRTTPDEMRKLLARQPVVIGVNAQLGRRGRAETRSLCP